MEAHKASLSINLLYWLSNLSIGLIVLSFLIAVAFNIFIYTGAFEALENKMTITVPFPVESNIVDAADLLSNRADVKLELVDVSGRLKIMNAPDSILKGMGFLSFYVILCSFLLAVIFRKFIRNVRNDIVFTVENINLLKFLSYGLVAVWFFQAILMRGLYFFIAHQLEFKDTSLRFDFFEYSYTLVIALVIWVLAHVFLKGMNLQEEKDLTI